MSKPTLEQLKYYLDAELKIIHGSDIFTVTGLSNDKIMFKGGFVELSDERTKYFLRPMSDLCKPITIEGEENIPIVELAKLSYPHRTWMWRENECVSLKYKFNYSLQYDAFEYSDRLNYWPVVNTAILYNWLFKHKFDVFNGIGTWAIDVNTLTENIY